MREGWKEVELAEIAYYVKDKIEADKLNSDNYISADNMIGNVGGITKSEYVPENGKSSYFIEDDILVSNIRPYFKKMWYATFCGGCSNDVFIIRIKDTSVDSKYLFYRLSNQDFFDFMMAGANGTKMPRGNKNAIITFKINLPALETQKKIASILSRYDDLIENNLKRIKILEEMAQQTYEEWFVRMRFPEHQSATINPATGLPEGWEKVKLGDVLTLNYGKALKQENRIAGNYNVYGSSGVVGTHNNFLVEGPSLIVGRKGNVGSVYYEPNPFYPIDTVYYVTSEYSLFYLYYTIKSLSFINNDAAVPGLNRDAAYFKEINLPNIDLINEFQDLCSSNYQIIFNLQNQNQRLREARDILLPRLMMGMIEV